VAAHSGDESPLPPPMWLQDEDDTASTAGGQRLHQYTPPEPRHQAATRCGKHAHAALPTGFRKSTAILRSWRLWSQKEHDTICMEESYVQRAKRYMLFSHRRPLSPAMVVRPLLWPRLLLTAHVCSKLSLCASSQEYSTPDPSITGSAWIPGSTSLKRL